MYVLFVMRIRARIDFYNYHFGSVMFQLLLMNNYRVPNIVSLLLFFFVIGIFMISHEHIVVTTPLITACAGLLIYSLATNEHRWLSNRVLVYVGTISYSLYLFPPTGNMSPIISKGELFLKCII